MRIFQLMKVEITKNDSEERVNTLVEFAEVFNLTSENEETKLSIGQEDDQKHNHKAAYVLRRARESFGELEFDE